MVSHATHSPCSFPPAKVPAALLPLIRGGGYVLPANILNVGNSYTINVPTYVDIAQHVVEIALQMGLAIDSEIYAVGGRTFKTNYEDAACLAKIASEQWTHGVLQGYSQEGVDAPSRADFLTYGNLQAQEFWDNNPKTRVILRETPPYQVGHADYSGSVFHNPDEMHEQLEEGYDLLLALIREENPGKHVSMIKMGTLMWALGCGLPTDHPSFRNFHDPDRTHPNIDRAWLEACGVIVNATGRNPAPFMAAAIAGLGDGSLVPTIDGELLGNWAYRWVKHRAYPVLFTTHPADTTVTPGEDAVFTVVVRATGAVTYQWYRDGSILTEETSPTLSLSAVVEGDDGAVFTCHATNSEGTTISEPATLTVQSVVLGPMLYIDWGLYTAWPLSAPWNKIEYTFGDYTPDFPLTLNKPDGTPSGHVISTLNNRHGYSSSNAGIASGSPYPNNASIDFIYGQNGADGESHIEHKITGFDPARTYTLDVFVSRNGVGDNRSARYTLTGATSVYVDLNASNNVTTVATTPAVQPNASGEFVLLVEKAPANNNASGFFYLGTLVFKVVG